MKRLTLLAFLGACQPVFAQGPFLRQHDQDSVIVGPFCVPDVGGVVIETTVDHDLTGLVITITPNAGSTSFSYTTTGIIDVTTPGTWENPAAGEIGVDKVTTGANTGCVLLHLRDEVLAVANATEWTVTFSDGGTAIMDRPVSILATLGQNDPQDANVVQFSGDSTAADNAELFFDGTNTMFGCTIATSATTPKFTVTCP